MREAAKNPTVNPTIGERVAFSSIASENSSWNAFGETRAPVAKNDRFRP